MQGLKAFFSWEMANLSRTQVDSCLPELRAEDGQRRQKVAVIPPPKPASTLCPNSTAVISQMRTSRRKPRATEATKQDFTQGRSGDAA